MTLHASYTPILDGQAQLAETVATFGPDRPADLNALRELLDSGGIALIKGGIAPETCARLTRELLHWARRTPSFRTHASAQIEALNFHRLDDGSAPAHIDHKMHVFGFGKLATLDQPLRETLRACSSALQDRTNRIAGTDFRIGEDGLRVMAMHLPRGGGFVAPHRHPYLPSRVVSVLILSQPGIDYAAGGPEFMTQSGWRRLTWQDGLEQGDIVLARSDLPHAFSPVDPEHETSFYSPCGLWALSCEHVASYSDARQLDP